MQLVQLRADFQGQTLLQTNLAWTQKHDYEELDEDIVYEFIFRYIKRSILLPSSRTKVALAALLAKIVCRYLP